MQPILEYLGPGCANVGRQVTWTTKLCTVAPDTCSSSVWNLVHGSRSFETPSRFLENVDTPKTGGGCLFPPKFSPYACVKFRRFSYFSYLFSNVYAIQSSDRNMLCWKHYLHPILQLQANAGLPRRSRLLDRQMKVKKLVTLNAWQ
jgi:hypothetical protein